MMIGKAKFVSLLISVVIAVLPFAAHAQKNSLPNIIVIFTDDQGYGDLGCFGAEGFETPNFDKLAADGIRFTNLYVPATVCTPSRAALLTGKYPKRLNLHEQVIYPYSNNGLDTSSVTLADMLKQQGYFTSIVGKWHLGHKPEYMPNNQGFDYYFGVPYSNDMNAHFYKSIGFQSPPLPLYRNWEMIGENPDQRQLTKTFTAETIDIIKRESKNPFFIYLAHIMPHLPLHASEDFVGKSKLGIYGDVIMELDWSIGEIVKALKQEGVYDNTIIFFTSDNGPVTSVGGSTAGLRGQKAQTWEGGQRVPGIMVWPNQVPPAKVSDQMITTMDLFPTLASITGYRIDDEMILDGMNIGKHLRKPNRKLADRPFLYYSRDGIVEAIRYGDWKLHIQKNIGWDKEKNGEFQPALYNLKTDSSESTDLSNEFPGKVKELEKILEDYSKTIVTAIR